MMCTIKEDFELAQELVKLVKQLSNTQDLLSTHNTDLLSNDLLRPDAYYQIKDNDIRSFDKLSNKELRRAHNIQKMYKAGGTLCQPTKKSLG